MTDSQLTTLTETLQNPLAEAGFDAPALVQQYVEETFGVEYSRPSCRRLLKEAGLSYQKPQRQAAEADDDEREEFSEEVKKARTRDATVMCRSDEEIGVGGAACRVVPARHAASGRYPVNGSGRACWA